MHHRHSKLSDAILLLYLLHHLLRQLWFCTTVEDPRYKNIFSFQMPYNRLLSLCLCLCLSLSFKYSVYANVPAPTTARPLFDFLCLFCLFQAPPKWHFPKSDASYGLEGARDGSGYSSVSFTFFHRLCRRGCSWGWYPFCLVLFLVMKSRHHLPFFFQLSIIFVLKNCTQLSHSIKLRSKKLKNEPFNCGLRPFSPYGYIGPLQNFYLFHHSSHSWSKIQLLGNSMSILLFQLSLSLSFSLSIALSRERENWNDGRLKFRSKAWAGAIIRFPYLHLAFPLTFG